MAEKLFNSHQYAPDATLLEGNDRAPMEQAIAQHVLGQRVRHVEYVKQFDPEKSREMGVPVDFFEVSIYLDNNICYLFRVSAVKGFTLNHGDGLAHVAADNPHHNPQPGS